MLRRRRRRGSTPQLPPSLTAVTPSILDTSGGMLRVSGSSLAGCTWTVGGVSATVIDDGSSFAVLNVAASAAGVKTVEAANVIGSDSISSAVEVWNPSSISGLAIYDAAIGTTLGTSRAQLLASLPHERTDLPFSGRDGASLHKIGAEYVLVGGWRPAGIYGGFGPGGTLDTTNEVLVSTDLTTWSTRLAHGHAQFTRRHTHNGITLGSTIVLIGGDHYTGAYHTDVARSTDGGVTWSTHSTPWSARMLQIAGVLGNDIYVFGGQTGFLGDPGVVYNDLWRSTDGGVTWTQIDAGGVGGVVRPVARATNARMVEFDGRLWLVGGAVYDVGGLPDTYLDDVWSYAPGTGWQAEASLPANSGRRYSSTFAVETESGEALVQLFGSKTGIGNTVNGLTSLDGVTWSAYTLPNVTDPNALLAAGSHADSCCVSGDTIVHVTGNHSIGPGGTPHNVRLFRVYVGQTVTAWNTATVATTGSASGSVAGVVTGMGSGMGVVFDGIKVAYELPTTSIQGAGRSVVWCGEFHYFDQKNQLLATQYSPNETMVGDASSSQFVAAGRHLGDTVAYTEGSAAWTLTDEGDARGLRCLAVTHATSGDIACFVDGSQVGPTATQGYSVANTGWLTIGCGLGQTYAYGQVGFVAVANSVLSGANLTKLSTWARGRFTDWRVTSGPFI